MEYGAQSAFDGARTLGIMLLAGAAMGVFYDMFRVFRRFIKCGYSTVFVQDTVFFIVSATGVFFTGITCSGGIMRISYAAAALAGWLIYYLTIGAAVMFAAGKTLALVRKITGRARRMISESVLGRKKSDRIT